MIFIKSEKILFCCVSAFKFVKKIGKNLIVSEEYAIYRSKWQKFYCFV
jgi:hypothetical protein